MRLSLKLNKRLFLYILLAIIIVSIAFPSINSFNLLNRKTDVKIKTSGKSSQNSIYSIILISKILIK